MNEEDMEKVKDLKAVYSGAVQAGEISISNMIKGGIDLIEKLRKENEDLKAKLEYKQYGDLDNPEFEKYINDIVETKTKVLKEQLEKEQELNKIIKETRINKVLENNIEVKRLREENEELKADNYEANNIIKDLLDNIPVQKVKDKIEELKNNIDYLKQFNDWNEKDYTNEDIINNVLEVLQELLEGSNEQNENI